MKKLILLVSLILFTSGCTSVNYEAFAKCLTDKGVIMFGSKYCGYCQQQRDMFGDAAQYLNYVDCAEEKNKNKCQEYNISGTPTWVFEDDRRLKGLQTFEEISKISGCELPQEDNQ
ncbi:hypothetical protein A2483_03925 [Candidatus Peregrinibacteria bacterium RIFOXYC2_FULL_33_13]|nr:MAG: hypothetical protein UR27_C0009G0020 [Candidatus Peregrinibacteria bacterium GW2011_GWA2_33_10]KKP41286.1 MAG: hypothetical protein UR30_C0001G0133 [Candidatus Peregrinibacteria bacterium GW2011_GWC2_33_13]OGJ47467.1 MAG: hypothetical protein A2229_03405 [Candidatus Peregrinibacteria bacterium RIFOXYA2_FULL_33_7]OGJ53788.1 MAG: hypothetical protein A2483_03925 [Candidatus Peregrinibacteria bacterium RIFOXYC2_FULL_33_13]